MKTSETMPSRVPNSFASKLDFVKQPWPMHTDDVFDEGKNC